MVQQSLLPLLLAFSSAISAAAIPEPSKHGAHVLNVRLPGSGLPAPAGKLLYIALGVGEQLYTCEGLIAGTDIEPLKTGAKAELRNAGPYLQAHPDLVDNLPGLARLAPKTVQQLPVLGRHYYIDGIPRKPVFDLSAVHAKFQGIKNAVTPSPRKDAVDWVKLVDSGDNKSFGGIKTAYRVETYGGKGPFNCLRSRGPESSPYSALYFFYG
ncbi:hypothetical protein FKW77_007709 [Venturia effusa]|uniref:Uncharacterized protein n=1 Tax=Venturia effusa TaxID=50376 RepID=A0A517L5T7_9PEZI|nr:hypothetical protein FKW77_007709 [Venturia effusa]